MEEKVKSKAKMEKKKKEKALFIPGHSKKRPKLLQSIDRPSTTEQGEPHTVEGPIMATHWKKKPKYVSILVQEHPWESEEQCLSRSSGLLENDPMDSEKSPLRKK